jgi:hypothetical protein
MRRKKGSRGGKLLRRMLGCFTWEQMVEEENLA